MTADEVPIGPLEAWRRDCNQKPYPDGQATQERRKSWCADIGGPLRWPLRLVLGGTLNAAQAPAPTPNLPTPPQVYKFVPGWPKPLPNNWAMGTVTGMYVDKEDHIWVLSRPEENSRNAPAVLEFDIEGNLLKSWGSPESAPEGVWPRQVHTIFTDRDTNVWVAGSAPGDTLVKFSPDGKFLRDFGNRGPVVERQGMIQNNQSKILLLGVSSAALDEAANEIFIADGYLNRRVTVFDLATGAFKRAWGAYGKPITEISNDPQPAHDPNDFKSADFKSAVHCIRIANDGLVYVCDRAGDRVQVFSKDGKFVKEFHVVNRRWATARSVRSISRATRRRSTSSSPTW